MSTHKQRVRSRARVAQVVAIAAAGVGAAAALVPIPGPTAASAGTGVTPPDIAPPQARRPVEAADIQIVAAMMNRSVEQKDRPGGKTEVAIVPKEPDKIDEGIPSEPVGETSGSWKYVSTIISPSGNVTAVVDDHDGKQYWLSAGEKRNATTVVSVAMDHIMVRDGDAPARRIDLQARSANLFPEAPIAMANGAPNAALPLELQKPPVGFDQWPPEQQQSWMERRQMVERQIAEQRMRNAQPNPGQRTPSPRNNAPVKQPAKEVK